MEKGGLDSAGREFKNAEEMWREQVGEDQSKKTEWYRQGIGYWEVSAFGNLLVWRPRRMECWEDMDMSMSLT